MAWFRVYDNLIDNPKVMRLKPDLFRALVSLWCLAKRYGGKLPPVHDIAFALRVNETKVTAWIEELKQSGLVDEAADGTLTPHDWNDHQYSSDNVTERVRKHRAKHREPVPRNRDETFPTNTETEAETEQSRAEGLGQSAPGGAPPADEIDELEIPIRLDRSDAGEVVRRWNAMAERIGLPKVQRLTDARRRLIAARLKMLGSWGALDGALAKVETSRFCRGEANGQGHDRWRATFDWFITERGMTRLIEGQYDDRDEDSTAKWRKEIEEMADAAS